MAEGTKTEKIHRTAQAVLGIVARYGIEAVNPSRVARAAGVSRAWIYKYLGGSKGEMSSFALEHFGLLFAQVNDPGTPLTPHRNQFLEEEMRRYRVAVDWARKQPELLQIYFRYKGTPTPLGKTIDKIEGAYRDLKTTQLQSAFGLRPERARVYAQVLASCKMALIHAWIFGNLRKEVGEDEYLAAVERLFRVFEEKKR